jgi:hypothetical protein
MQPAAELTPFRSSQGTGGTGAVPFFATISGSGELAPFRSVQPASVRSTQGTGGTGAVPFFATISGSGELAPFRSMQPAAQGTGGTGAVPFAINTEESPWVVTTVFRPIAPVKTSMARTITDEMRDIVPPGEMVPRAHSIRY